MAKVHPPRTKVAVVGGGVMGQNHLRVYNQLKGVDLIGVVETDPDRARDVAARYGCEAFSSLDQIIGHVDAVSVVSPSSTHVDVAKVLLEAGVHCLVEKPLATTEEDCALLRDVAAKAGVVLTVGHIERFNPAVQKLSEILEGRSRIHAIDVHRMSKASRRITDVDVVMDLMVHDLDIVLSLVQQPVAKVTAQGVTVDGSPGSDYVTALLTFASGTMASLTASRITQNKIRTLNLTSDLGFMMLDFIDQKLAIYQQGGDSLIGSQTPEWGNFAIDIAMERVLVRNAEPLVLELQHFMDCVARGATPKVTADDAIAVLRLVRTIQAQTNG